MGHALARRERRESIEVALSRVREALQACKPLDTTALQSFPAAPPSSVDPATGAVDFAPSVVGAWNGCEAGSAQAAPLRPPAQPRLLSNGAWPAQLFHPAPSTAGANNERGAQRLTDPWRASLLGQLVDFRPSDPAKWRDSEQRLCFERALVHARQAHLCASVEAELRRAAPERIWCRDGRVYFHNAESQGVPLLADVDAWAQFVRGPAPPDLQPGATFAIPRSLPSTADGDLPAPTPHGTKCQLSAPRTW